MVGINGRVSEELNSRSTKQVSDAKNFASPRRSAHADVEDLFTPRKASESQCPSVEHPNVKRILSVFLAFSKILNVV